MREWLKIAFGVIMGLFIAGLILLISLPPRGQAIVLLPPPTPAPIAVDVVGAVISPGLYMLPADSRVKDAIDAAGGVLAEANLQAVNQAAFLEDGGRVIVPFQATLPPASRAILVTGETLAAPTAGSQYPININTASQEELESLPGIGPVIAARIIAYRETHGLFTNIEDIQNVSGIGPKTYEDIKDLITVGP